MRAPAPLTDRDLRKLAAADLRERLQRVRGRLAAAPQLRRAALRAAYDQWSGRRPWRLLPRWLRVYLFSAVGRRYAKRYVHEVTHA